MGLPVIRLTTTAAKYQPDDYHIVDISISFSSFELLCVCVLGGYRHQIYWFKCHIYIKIQENMNQI